MTKQQKQIVAKVVLAVALVLLAACVTVVIRDILSYHNPASVLPDMHAYFTGIGNKEERLNASFVRRDSYSWRFLVGTVNWHGVDPEVWREIEPAWLQPGATLRFDFSFDTESVRVSMMNEQYPSAGFVELGGVLQTPQEAGVYTYKVEADFGDGNRVVYYLRIQVPVW